MKKVGILMGSDSDLPVVQKAIDVLRELDIPFEAHVDVYKRQVPPRAARSDGTEGDGGRGNRP